jgi:plastocyanin
MPSRAHFVRPSLALLSRPTVRFSNAILASVFMLLMTLGHGFGAGSAAWAHEAEGAYQYAAAQAGEATVSIENFTFGPEVLTVKAGTKVTWVNHDDIPHNVVEKNKKLFRSKVLDTGDSFSFVFAEPGDYGYFCGLHPHMTGHIVVVS